MNYLRRAIDQVLLDWKQDASRKPLLLRGARQTGKTTAVRHLANSFEHFVEVNFEQDSGVQEFFAGDLEVRAICAKLEMRYNTPLLAGRTLLFLDEIQSCPAAISALRYFYEDYPELHVIASGSLLEFAFANLSDFGVGRIRNLFIYPLSFEEFAWATGNALLYAGMLDAGFARPLSPMTKTSGQHAAQSPHPMHVSLTVYFMMMPSFYSNVRSSAILNLFAAFT